MKIINITQLFTCKNLKREILTLSNSYKNEIVKIMVLGQKQFYIPLFFIECKFPFSVKCNISYKFMITYRGEMYISYLVMNDTSYSYPV